MEVFYTIGITLCLYFIIGELNVNMAALFLKRYFNTYITNDFFTVNKNKTIIYNSFGKEAGFNKLNIFLISNTVEINGFTFNYKYCWIYAPYTYFTVARKVQKFIKTIEIDKLPVY